VSPDPATIEQQLAQIGAEAAVLRLRVEELEDQHAFDDQRIVALRTQRNELAAAHESAVAAAEHLRLEATEHDSVLAERDARLAERDGIVAAVRQERDALERTTAEFEHRLAGLESALATAGAQHRQATERIAYLERELDVATGRISALVDAERIHEGDAATLRAHGDELKAALDAERAALADVTGTLERQRFEQRALVSDLVRAQSTLVARSDQLQKLLTSRWYRVARSAWQVRRRQPPAGALVLAGVAAAIAVLAVVLGASFAAVLSGLLVAAIVGAGAVAYAVVVPALRDQRVPRMAGEASYVQALTDDGDGAAAVPGPVAAAAPAASPAPIAAAPAGPPAAAPAPPPAATAAPRLVPAAPAGVPPVDAARQRWLAEARSTGLRDLRVAGILDEMSRACFAPECVLDTNFTMDDWRAKLDADPPHLLLVESAWTGNNGGWQYGVASYEHPRYAGLPFLRELLAWCREREIPTVFWNKEDPVHFERFREAAALFDHIFTTDAGRIPAYYDLRGEHVQSVAALPFAAQPRLHNPISLVDERRREPVFAGTYYRNRHVDRRASLEMILDAARPAGLVIYDRTFGTTSDEYGFPERFVPHVRGRLPYDEVVDTYKRHRVFLNVNSVADSPTMFSRRVFELLACGTAVLSTESVGMTAMFGDLVPVATTPEQAASHLERLLGDDAHWAALTARGRQLVLGEHTYRERLADIARTAGFDLSLTSGEEVAAIALVDRDEDLTPLADALLAQSTAPEEILLGLTDETVGRADRARLEDRFGVARVRVIAQDAQAAPDARLRELAVLSAAPWIAPLHRATEYDEHHLRDLAACTRFADADVIGRADGPRSAHRYGSGSAPFASLAARDVVAARGWPSDPADLARWFGQGVRFYTGEVPAGTAGGTGGSTASPPSPAAAPAPAAPTPRRGRNGRLRRR